MQGVCPPRFAAKGFTKGISFRCNGPLQRNGFSFVNALSIVKKEGDGFCFSREGVGKFWRGLGSDLGPGRPCPAAAPKGSSVAISSFLQPDSQQGNSAGQCPSGGTSGAENWHIWSTSLAHRGAIWCISGCLGPGCVRGFLKKKITLNDIKGSPGSPGVPRDPQGPPGTPTKKYE